MWIPRKNAASPLAAMLLLAAPLVAIAAEAKGKSAADQTFVTKAANGGMAEVEMGKLATEKGFSADVRTFGERMIADHTPANQELEKIASDKGLNVPKDVDAEHKSKLEMLRGKSGAEFDRAYMKDQVLGHAKMHELLDQQAKTGADPDLKAYAKKTLPTVEQHHRTAEEIQAKVGK